MKKLAEKITEKQISIVMLVVFLLSLLPILMLAKYNYPGADDFSASYTLRHAWVETGSVWAVLGKAIAYVKYTYTQWSGLFMSMFWTCLQPAVFGEQYYGITTVISIFLLVAGGFYFVHVLVEKCIGGTRAQVISLGSIYLFLLIQCMPDGNEGLYWHSGVVNYTWGFAFLLMLTGITVFLMLEEETKKRRIKLVLSIVFAIFVGGGNLLTALQGCIWMVMIAILFVMINMKKQECKLLEVIGKRKDVFVPTFVIIIAFAVSVFAPGNKVRMSLSGNGLGPIQAILESFIYCIEMPLKHWLRIPEILLLLLAIPFMWEVAKRSKLSYACPQLVATFGFLVASAAYTPNLYAQGNMIAGRLHDTAYFIFITVLFVVIFYVIGWIQQRVKCKTSNVAEIILSEKKLLYIVGISVLLVGSSVFYIAVGGNPYIGSEALQCMVSGQAETYKEENLIRIEKFHNSDVKEVELTGFSNPPQLLHFQDVAWDENDWINHAVARYYGKNSVRRVE